MRTFDFSPLYRSTVGFDRLASMLDNVMTAEQSGAPGYPPYNIEKTGETSYRITVAAAGFAEDELSVESRDGQLVISGRKPEGEEGEAPVYLHRGIAARAFEKRFQLADHVRPVAAKTENGLLHVDLVREVPEALRPRRIEIQSANGTRKAIEGEAEKTVN
ncbi:Hsp20 family protein [Rhodovulum sp. DZ06]|uniref:Hsp20 family protein n=1 Tax=Rhodovulum sp. DZ06 TaxID=3425126 RepID=UPI003D342D21